MAKKEIIQFAEEQVMNFFVVKIANEHFLKRANELKRFLMKKVKLNDL
jgi:hypothetical protein